MTDLHLQEEATRRAISRLAAEERKVMEQEEAARKAAENARQAEQRGLQARREAAIQSSLENLKPLYARRAEILAELAPRLGELWEVETKLSNSLDSAWKALPDSYSGATERNKRWLALRAGAGLPEMHDAIAQPSGDPGGLFAWAVGTLCAAHILGPGWLSFAGRLWGKLN